MHPSLSIPAISSTDNGDLRAARIPERQMRVVYYQRKAYGAYFSLERVFDAVRCSLPDYVSASCWTCRFQSRGLVKRVLNALEAPFHQGDINHITGDVHYLAAGLSRKKTVLTIHDAAGPRFATGVKRTVLALFWYALPARRAAVITAISEFTRTEIIRYSGCDGRRVRVVHDPVPDGFIPWPKPFDEGMPVILQVGTGQHNKNICRIAEALQGIPCRLAFIGRLSEVQKEALRKHSISYTERWGLSDEEVIEQYRRCDIVILASLYEGFGMPIVEGNATGRPVITSNICSMPEVAGQAACLVDPFDYQSIRQGILKVIGDAEYRAELVANGFENVKRFHPRIIAEQYTAIYQELLEPSRVPENLRSAPGRQRPIDQTE